MKTIKIICIVAIIGAAAALSFRAAAPLGNAVMLDRIQTDAAHNWPKEKFRGCPNITYHVPDGHTVRGSDEWDQSLREAVKQWQQAAQRKERPKQQQPRPPRVADLGDVFGRTMHPCTPPCVQQYNGQLRTLSRSDVAAPLL